MAEILNIADFRPPAPQRVVVALEDALFVMLPTTQFRTAGGVEVRYVRASLLDDPSREADLWIGPYVPSAPGRRLFFQTLSSAVYEIDEQRLVYRDGELIWSEPLRDFGLAATARRGVLEVGHEAALLFLAPVDTGWHVRIRLTTPVLILGQLPPIDPRFPVPKDWLRLARAERGRASP